MPRQRRIGLEGSIGKVLCTPKLGGRRKRRTFAILGFGRLSRPRKAFGMIERATGETSITSARVLIMQYTGQVRRGVPVNSGCSRLWAMPFHRSSTPRCSGRKQAPASR
jgi:hypothetical protein